MKLRDLIALVYSNLNRMRGRVVMTAMGVVIGTAAIVVLIALSTGLQNNTVNNFSSFGNLNQITVFSGSRFGGQTSGQGLTPDVIKQLKGITGVVAITPYEDLGGRATLKLNRLEGFGSIYGIDPLVVPQMDFTMDKGVAYVTRGTVIVGSSVGSSFSVAGQGGARRQGGGGGRFIAGGGGGNILGGLLGGGGRPVQNSVTPTTTPTGPELFGQTLLLVLSRNSGGQAETHTARLRVGGVLKSTGGNEDYNIYMSIGDVTDLLTWSRGARPNWTKDGYSQVMVIAEQDPQVTLDVTNEITAEGFFALSTNSVVASLNSTFQIIQAVLGGIASIALLVAAIGIANTMIMSVLERTREIGLMKAVGARNSDILTVFIAEAATIGLLGGLSGVIIGIVLSKLIDLIASSLLSSNGTTVTSIVAIPLWLPIFAIGFSVVIGLAAGIYPAFRAVQLDPVQALRYE
jgi:putative ABC transport system permease protein